MARGGGRRTYVRDSAGRFASTTGSAAKKAAKSQSGRTSTLQARSSLKRSRAKLAAKDRADETLQGTLGRRAQKGAVTRGSKKLAGAKVAARTKLETKKSVGAIKMPAAQKNNNEKRSNKTSRRQGVRTGNGKPLKDPNRKKAVVNIKRAAPGGEYGSDGHFYSGGSWMPLGKFSGGGKQARPDGEGVAKNMKQKTESSGQPARVINQKPKPRPPLQPAQSTQTPQVNISNRGKDNMNRFFKDGFYSFYKRGSGGSIELKQSGWLLDAAVATRIPPKEAGKAIVKLRKMATDKNYFDKQLAWERQMWKRSFGYEEAKRQGYLPRNMTPNQYGRAQQLQAAISTIAQQRGSRPNNRRTVSEEYVWVMNNILGKRESRKPQAASPKAAGKTRKFLPKIQGTTRPISAAKLVSAGGSPWQKGTFDRIYFNQPNTGKVFFDKTTRNMVSQSGDKKGRDLALQMTKAGQRSPSRKWKTAKQLLRKPKP